MDRLAVHRAQIVKEKAAELQIPIILNASYSPDFNPIEGVIGLAKAQIKRERWRALQNGSQINLAELIKLCFRRVDKQKIKNLI